MRDNFRGGADQGSGLAGRSFGNTGGRGGRAIDNRPYGRFTGSAEIAGGRAAEGGGPYGRFTGSAVCPRIPAVDEKSTSQGTGYARSAGREKRPCVHASSFLRSVDEWSALARGPKRSLFSYTVHGAFSFLWQDREKRMGGASPDTPERRVAVPGPWPENPRPAPEARSPRPRPRREPPML